MNNKATIKLFWQHAKRYPKYLAGIFTFLPLALLTHQFLPPLIAANILDRLSKGQFEHGNLWGSFGNDLLLYALIAITGGVVIWRIVIIFVWKMEALVTRDLDRRVFSHLLLLDANFHANSFGGSLVSQASKLRGSYVRMADTTIFDITTLLFAFMFTTIILLPRAPLYVALLFTFSAIYMVIAVLVTKKIRKLNAVQAEAENKQTGLLADAISNVLAIKGFAAGREEAKNFYRATENTRLKTMDVMRASIKRDVLFGGVTMSIQVIALIMATASVVWFNSEISTVFLILSYTGNILQRLWEFSQQTLRNYNRALGDSQEMVNKLLLEPAVKDIAKPQKSRITSGAISFNHMDFTHADSGKDASLFDKLDLQIAAGEKIGLVGHSGSGKTTLTKLLLRFADIDGGEILIDGQSIGDISQDDLRASIAYVPQEPLLFHRTIRENIAYGKPGATDAEISAAARKANAAEFIEKLPKAYETLVGERGVKLSGGQRQRIAIARAILKDAPILVLDEATSALDSESERLIQAALRELMKDRTAIVIAHRLSTIQKMDRIIVLDNGKIVEQGSHAQLIDKNGTYAKLWAHQSGGFIEE